MSIPTWSRRRRVAGLLVASCWLGALVMNVGGCAEILGVNDDVEDAVQQLCKCGDLESFWPKDDAASAFYTCEEWVGGALEANPTQEKAWLDVFQAQKCDVCANSQVCAREPPVCIPAGSGPCANDQSCCGYDPEVSTGGYCGIFDDGARKCTGDATTCTQPGGACSMNEECCGYSGHLAICSPQLGLCLAACDPDNPILCPDCCALIKAPGDPPEKAVPICIDSLPFTNGDPECGKTCTGSCDGIGQVCDFTNRAIDVSIGTAFVNVSECQMSFSHD